MKHFLTLILTVLIACSSCKKEEEHLAVVSYKVTVTNGINLSYTSIYSADNATQTTGPISASSWSSANFQKKRGDHVSFTVDGGGSSGDFSFSIFVNGSLVKNSTFVMPSSPKTIETDIF